MIEASLFRESMSRLGAAVTLIATDGPAGRHGFTASAVCSVTDTPPTLLICMNRSVSSHADFMANGVLSVNVLAGAHEMLSNTFANRSVSMSDRFGATTWSAGLTGAPLLHGAAASFDCRISEVSEIGTHSVLFCEIRQIVLGDAVPDALLWCSRGYHRLPLRSA